MAMELCTLCSVWLRCARSLAWPAPVTVVSWITGEVIRLCLKVSCTNVVHDLGSAEPRSKVEPSSC